MSGSEVRRRLHVAMLGTRGVPARYGGFETAIEEIGRRLVERGHVVTVYCRRPSDEHVLPPSYLGMRLVELPALRRRSLETLSHSALSVAHAVSRASVDAVFVFNSANAPLLPVLRARRLPVAVHVDGLEWQRSKWDGAGRNYYRMAECLSVRWADALIADAQGIADYYLEEFGASTELISYGAPVLDRFGDDRLEPLGLTPRRYHLVVARFEPENHVDLVVRGFLRSSSQLPLVVVGGAPYSDDYTARIAADAGSDNRIHLVGPVWDQQQLDQLYANALTYLHGHSVGGTNPSLLRAMGAGAPVCAYDVVFNREVAGATGSYFSDEDEVAEVIDAAESAPDAAFERGGAGRDRVRERYDWEQVADSYEHLACRLASGLTRKGERSGRRNKATQWHASGPQPTRG